MDVEPYNKSERRTVMQKVFMTAKEVQDFLEVSRTTAYQLINEMNQELMNLGYRVQRGKVNRQYFMEKYCYGKELRRDNDILSLSLNDAKLYKAIHYSPIIKITDIYHE